MPINYKEFENPKRLQFESMFNLSANFLSNCNLNDSYADENQQGQASESGTDSPRAILGACRNRLIASRYGWLSVPLNSVFSPMPPSTALPERGWENMIINNVGIKVYSAQTWMSRNALSEVFSIFFTSNRISR